MRNSHFQFKKFTIHQDRCAMKVTTDGCLFGASVAASLSNQNVTHKHLLDIGTGTGLLPLMIAQKNESINIDAIEIDEDAYHQAKENTSASPWIKNIQVLQGDANTYSFYKKYDIIVSNPPFYENELQSPHTAKNKAHHSSRLTWQQLFAITHTLLTDQGVFFFLLPFKRNEEIEGLLQSNNLFLQEKILIKQSEHHHYFRIVLTGCKQKPQSISEKEITICTTPPHYTNTFTSLLNDYYLHL